MGESLAGKWEKEMLVIWLEIFLRFDQQARHGAQFKFSTIGGGTFGHSNQFFSIILKTRKTINYDL